MSTAYSAFFLLAIPMVYISIVYKNDYISFFQYPIILYTHLFHVDTLSTKKNLPQSALICCALHQREEAVWEPSGCKRLLRLTRPPPIMKNLRRLLSNATQEIKA